MCSRYLIFSGLRSPMEIQAAQKRRCVQSTSLPGALGFESMSVVNIRNMRGQLFVH